MSVLFSCFNTTPFDTRVEGRKLPQSPVLCYFNAFLYMRLSPDIVDIVWVSVSALCSAVHDCVIPQMHHSRKEVGPANLSSYEYRSSSYDLWTGEPYALN